MASSLSVWTSWVFFQVKPMLTLVAHCSLPLALSYRLLGPHPSLLFILSFSFFSFSFVAWVLPLLPAVSWIHTLLSPVSNASDIFLERRSLRAEKDGSKSSRMASRIISVPKNVTGPALGTTAISNYLATNFVPPLWLPQNCRTSSYSRIPIFP